MKTNEIIVINFYFVSSPYDSKVIGHSPARCRFGENFTDVSTNTIKKYYIFSSVVDVHKTY